MNVSTGVFSYFNNTDCLEYLSRECARLTSENRDEIFEKYKLHLHSISSSKSMLKRAKDKACKLENSAELTFQRKEVSIFFEKLDTEAKTNATANLTNAMRNFVNENENLFESKLEARAYGKITRRIEDTDTEEGCSYKRSRQSKDDDENTKRNEKINLQPDANTVPKADDDKFEEQENEEDRDKYDTVMVEELNSSNFVLLPLTNVSPETCLQQKTLNVLRQYCVKENTSPYDPAHSFIMDLSPSSKIKDEFS
ncbi:hypothetical protein Glove_199g100 [Diversispora epigaea]|uniref:Uncharacterized protein n=1 Tax=Diversispora epigaea TaxID=1348612 RepID=A0A397IPV3_9GLOM|nr:hypothetical protein Glove_199g100 [Diversispora epigaea]